MPGMDWKKIMEDREAADKEYSKKRKGQLRKLIEEGVEKAGSAGYPDVGAGLGTIADIAVEAVPEDMPSAMVGSMRSFGGGGTAAGKLRRAGAEVSESAEKSGILSKIPEKDYDKAIDKLSRGHKYPVEVVDESGQRVLKYISKKDPEVKEVVEKYLEKEEAKQLLGRGGGGKK